MEQKPIIEIRNIGKRYNITHQRGGYVTLRDILVGIARRPFAFLKHKAKRVVGLETKENFWALRHVNVNINKGDIVGIIGHNGAGKSTLLKILTGITPPTEGEIIMRGRVASLLEVGTGFHPELTGRENIFLNGAILGMTKNEIARKFDDIVAFAGIEKFLDTPVRHYSSGMYVRLAFSVAAHMEPDILLVDEVLAVGDAEFQKKCLGKMSEITQKDGRTIFFVSHNMSAIRQLCDTCILLNNGTVEKAGPTEEVIDFYLNGDKSLSAVQLAENDERYHTRITKIAIHNKNGVPSSQIPVSEDFSITLHYTVNQTIEAAFLSTLFYSGHDLLLQSSESDKTGELHSFLPGTYEAVIKVPAFLFNVGHFFFDIIIQQPGIHVFVHRRMEIDITDYNNPKTNLYRGNIPGKISPLLDYKVEKISQ